MQQKPVFTLRGNSNLIFVIDGVIVEPEVFQALDPNNIANINVLKGLQLLHFMVLEVDMELF